jgi:hypothetical protein
MGNENKFIPNFIKEIKTDSFTKFSIWSLLAGIFWATAFGFAEYYEIKDHGVRITNAECDIKILKTNSVQDHEKISVMANNIEWLVADRKKSK